MRSSGPIHEARRPRALASATTARAVLKPAKAHDWMGGYHDTRALVRFCRAFGRPDATRATRAVSSRGAWDLAPASRYGDGSRGNPSVRSAITLRWISDVPPKIVVDNEKRKPICMGLAG